MTEVLDVSSAADALSDLFDHYSSGVVVLTGAGISTDSGIPDFRSAGGQWRRMEPVDFSDFVEKEESRLEDWQRRFEMKGVFETAQPNAAHQFLAECDASGHLDLLITQNIDGLHQRAGVREDSLIELHGNGTYAACLSCEQEMSLESCQESVTSGQSPTCERCGGLVKAAVVSFGQQLPQEALMQSMEAARLAHLFIVIGSSLVVQPAAQLPALAARSGAEFVLVNREATPLDDYADLIIRTPIAETFDQVRNLREAKKG